MRISQILPQIQNLFQAGLVNKKVATITAKPDDRNAKKQKYSFGSCGENEKTPPCPAAV